jgi:hypothetical protein
MSRSWGPIEVGFVRGRSDRSPAAELLPGTLDRDPDLARNPVDPSRLEPITTFEPKNSFGILRDDEEYSNRAAVLKLNRFAKAHYLT